MRIKLALATMAISVSSSFTLDGLANARADEPVQKGHQHTQAPVVTPEGNWDPGYEGECGTVCPDGYQCCVPRPWWSCGELYPHYPYDAHPKTYYYFRPYSYLHIRDQQQAAVEMNAPASRPYSNSMFSAVYQEMAGKIENSMVNKR